MLFRMRCVVCLVCVACLCVACGPKIVDSQLYSSQAIYTNQPPDVVADIQHHLVVVDVQYFGFDWRRHKGQVVVHEALASDIEKMFKLMERHRFPVESVIPIAHPEIQKKGPYGLSPDTNNTSSYAWRPVVTARKLSMHALGLAIDINPRINPYIKGDLVLPPDASYNPARPGTLTADSPIVKGFKQLGWQWGGDWHECVDYMHFQKIPQGSKEWVTQQREAFLREN